ncbi:hypothetical protein DFH11DRAFT_1744573 [Phellopilus nigrolimitatus]|nr:hypothetical protein DFH11DRAFT_1744573 [Phellopilus nigrolimitatus]
MSDIPKGPAGIALAIADIQNQIFSLIEKSDSARCARVCRQWQETALDHVWSSMYSLIPLVQLLAPLELASSAGGKPNCPKSRLLKFSRNIRAKDWEKLMPYARRVRNLEIRLSETFSTKLDNSVFIELARCRRILSILPNLSALKVVRLPLYEHEGWPKHLFLFLHGGIQSLDLEIETVKQGDQALYLLFDDISEWCPMISELTINAGGDTIIVNFSISNFLSRLAYLKTFRINPCSLTQNVLNALASLQNLQTIQIIPIIFAYPPTKFQRLNTDGAFPQLKSIPLSGDLGSVCLLLGSPNAFQNLLELDLHDVDNHNEGTCELVHLYSLFNLIPRACPLLRRLAVKGNIVLEPQDEPILFIHAENLKPLTSLPHLEMLKLDLIHPIDITNGQIVDTFGKCNSLTTLVLSTKPLVWGFSTSLTLDVLLLLSEACPQLVELGLYVDAGVIPNTPDLLHVRGFRKLQILDLGASPIYDPENASLYLGSIIPSQCTFEVHSPPEMENEDMDVFFERWMEVKKLLPFFIQSHENSQKAIQALRQERDEQIGSLRVEMLAWRSRALGSETTAICHQF